MTFYYARRHDLIKCLPGCIVTGTYSDFSQMGWKSCKVGQDIHQHPPYIIMQLICLVPHAVILRLHWDIQNKSRLSSNSKTAFVYYTIEQTEL